MGRAVITRSTELLAIAKDLQVVFPLLDQIAPLRILGAGFGSLVVETAGGVVFRIAKNQATAVGQAKEVRLLPSLGMRVSLSVPRPEWYAPPAPMRFPFGVMGYKKLPGRPLPRKHFPQSLETRLVSDIARFLGELHRFPVDEALALGIPGPEEGWREVQAMHERSLRHFGQILTEWEYRLLVAWWDSFLDDPRMRKYSPTVCHGDLWYENTLVDNATRTVTGILDFENAAVADPAQDFAVQLYRGKQFADRVLDAYRAAGGPIDSDIRYRIERLWELREAGVPDDPAEFADQVRKLRAGPILKQA